MKAKPTNFERAVVTSGLLAALRAGLLILLGIGAESARAQTVVSETTWGGANSETGEAVAVASDGSSYVVGITRTFGSSPGTPIAYAVKFLNDGSLAWQRTWDGPSPFFSDEPQDVAVAPDGSVYVAGFTFGGVTSDALLLHFASDGSLLSDRRWDSGEGDFANAVAVAPDGSTYLVGSTRASDLNALDVFVVKVATDGSIVWQKTWGTLDESQEGQGVAVGADGSVYVAAYHSRPNVAFEFDTALLKIDAAGNLLWARTFPGGSGSDSRGGVAVAPDGSANVLGGVFDPRTSDLDALIVKFNAAGALVWARSLGNNSTGDDPAGIAVTPQGTLLVAGQTGLGAGGDDAFLARIQPNGRLLDVVTWGSPNLDRGSGVDVAPGGVISLGGTVEAPPPYSLLRAQMRLSRARGNVGTPATPLANVAGAFADAGGVVSTPAGSTTYAGSFDAALVRIAPAAAALEGQLLAGEAAVDDAESGDNLELRAQVSSVSPGTRVSPNPAVDTVRLTFSFPAATKERSFSTTVFDAAGRRVRALPGGPTRDSSVQVAWDLRDDAGTRVASGIYFVSAALGSERRVGRVSVVR